MTAKPASHALPWALSPLATGSGVFPRTASNGPEWISTPQELADRIPACQLAEVEMLCSVFPELVVGIASNNEPLLKLRLDTAHRRSVFLFIQLPEAFDPALGGAGHAGRPRMTLRGANVSMRVIADLQASLNGIVEELSATGSLNLLGVICQIAEMVKDVPPSSLCDGFGICPACNAAARRRGRTKVPQPLHLEPPSAPGMAPTPVCLSCGCECDVILAPTMLQNRDDSLCSFCYFDDNPLIHMTCGCLACFSCFVTFSGLSSTAQDVKRGTCKAWYGVVCPTHPGHSIEDVTLYKLLDTAVYLRITNFAAVHCCQALGGHMCFNPVCGAPVINDITGDKFCCKQCRTWSCAACQSVLFRCTCESWPAPQLRRDNWRGKMQDMWSTVILTRDLRTVLCRELHLLFVCGSNRAAVAVKSNDVTWPALAQAQLFDNNNNIEKSLMFVFQGVPLSTKHPLGAFPVYTGAIIIVIEVGEVHGSTTLVTEMDLFDFRIEVARQRKEPSSADLEKSNGAISKRCPKCAKPVVHYRDHGCHHINACCRFDWCYVCRSPYPCQTCPMFCNSDCGCLPCPDCRPGRPCAQCMSCSRCRTLDADAFH